MLVLRGGLVIDPAHELETQADVVLEEGRVVAVEPSFDAPADATVRDVSGCWLVPGLIDLRTHLREPGQEYKEDLASGLAAAAAGGFGAVCAMPGTSPVNDTRAVTDLIVSRARALGGVRVWPFAAITKGLAGRELTEMHELREAGAVGVTDDLHPVTDAGLLRRALEYARTFDLVVMQHCEEPNLARGAQMHEGVHSTRLGLSGWPREAEEAAVARDVRVAELTGAHLHVAHVSSRGAVALIRDAKARGVRVTADVTPHHLTFTDEAVLGYDTMAKVLPPLCEASDRDALREGLEDGTLDCIATDHAPHTALEKDCEFDAAAVGMTGLELALPMVCALVEAGVLSRRRAIAALTTGPAGVLGKTSSVRGGDALTVVDPAHGWTVRPEALRSKSHNTPLLGREVRGAARMTFVEGRLVFDREAEAAPDPHSPPEARA
ncbi:MAG TPA: dihydroorotase [Polyangiaceae bacterium LLY-WYZ-15_(1-7)]|nr:dihydroorotase [Polyangiaceae bacterium LLY-WYZ-15_(1-7)]